MKQRTLGTSLTCGVIGLGCNQMLDLASEEAVEVATLVVALTPG